MLSQTMLGAVSQLPGVDDLRHCSWEAQKSLWASNSASLVAAMQAGKPVYFVSGIDILGDHQRPYGETAAFGSELPILGRGYNHVPELTAINIHQTTQLDHLCAAVRGALGVGADKLQIRKADCRHCISKQLPGNCMRACIQNATIFQPKDYERVLGDEKSFARMLQNGFWMTSVEAQSLLDRALEQSNLALAQACVKMGAGGQEQQWNSQAFAGSRNSGPECEPGEAAWEARRPHTQESWWGSASGLKERRFRVGGHASGGRCPPRWPG